MDTRPTKIGSMNVRRALENPHPLRATVLPVTTKAE